MSLTYNEAVEFLTLKKIWNSTTFPWKSKDKHRTPPTLECRVTLRDKHGIMEDVFVVLRHKSSPLPGIPDCFNATLIFRQQRLIALDENGPRTHTNRVGFGMPFFGKKLSHPHIHIPVSDSMDGYAEPIDTRDVQIQWQIFLDKSGIVGAPDLKLPTTGQLDLMF